MLDQKLVSMRNSDMPLLDKWFLRRMAKSEKTDVFWLGVVVLALASLGLFSLVWYTAIADDWNHLGAYYWKFYTPPIIGAIVFILIGFWMMKSGLRKNTSLNA